MRTDLAISFMRVHKQKTFHITLRPSVIFVFVLSSIFYHALNTVIFFLHIVQCFLQIFCP
ncbi:hypothetical protein CW304_24855 [Bacillus sp. UFRGS-B20]|nr:hypothetical protein CW304_24855 [Bacillus sp. UFRGS-B20]